MVIIKIMGGLGNQLFQYGCARAIQEKHNMEMVYDISYYKNDPFGRKFQLTDFPNIQLSNAQVANYKKVLQINDIFDHQSFSEINFSDADILFSLNGYWQSQKYFYDISSKIRKELSSNLDISQDENSVSIHVRRTDYLNLQHIHPVQTVEYYQNAIDEIGPVDKIYVFSDDISWCETNLKFNNVEFVKNNTAIFDMWKMSACTHNIIANSSFSWWGAWLNNSPDKRVIAPLNWFGNDHIHSDKDIVPECWKRI